MIIFFDSLCHIEFYWRIRYNKYSKIKEKTMNLLLKWLIMAVSILLASYFLPGINVDGLWTALVLAVILGLINITLKPILLVVTLPINVLTLGLFTLVINALMVLLATTIVKGFVVDGFFAAMIFSLLLSLINYVLGRLLDPIK